MKHLLVTCFLILSLTSCSLENDYIPVAQQEYVPIASVEVPEEFVLGEIYPIYVTYLRPSGCHLFYNFYYEAEENQRTVAVINTVYSNSECQTYDQEEVEVSFDFMPNQSGTYVFRFWQGKDEAGNDTYYIVEVPVVD
ncbi:MAG: hypothetical protein ACSHXF_02490 [Aquaticitalea sp.]